MRSVQIYDKNEKNRLKEYIYIYIYIYIKMKNYQSAKKVN